MTLQVLVPHFSCVVYSEDALKQAIEEGYCETYIVSKNGAFRRTNLTHGRSVTVPCPVMPAGITLPDCKQDTAGFFPAGKIPIRFLHEITAFFKAVMKEHNNAKLEAMAFVIWNPTLGYHIRIPEQTVSGASVSYNWEGFMGPDDVIVLDIHSHNDMGAFFSGTDDNDDRGNCYISGVIGKLSTTCDMVFRFNLPGNMKIDKMDMGHIFENEAGPEVPKEWLNQVKKQVYTPPPRTVYGGQNYTQNSGGAAGRNNGVVANQNFQGGNGRVALEQLGVNVDSLSDDDMKLLEDFGYPFPYSEGGHERPFSLCPLPQGHKARGKNKGKNKNVVGSSTRLPRSTRKART